MAKSSGPSLLTLGLLAVGGYFLYEWFFAPSAAASTTGTTGTPGTTPATPAPQLSAFNHLDAIYQRLKAAVSQDPNFTGSGDSLAASPYRWNYYLARVWDGTLSGTGTPTTPTNLPDPQTVFASLGQAWIQQQTTTQQASLSGLGLASRGFTPVRYPTGNPITNPTVNPVSNPVRSGPGRSPAAPPTMTDFLNQPMTAIVYWGAMAPALKQMVPGLAGYRGLGLYGAIGAAAVAAKQRYV